MDAYKYRPIDLEGPAFRLLRLLKGSGSDIRCELFDAWLGVEDLVQYEAVSYTWGGIEQSASVEVDRKLLNVTENLYLALHYLQTDAEDRILWVDAICIDQNNYQERGHQVKQMGNIYSQADRVVVWLGPATDDTDVLMNSLKCLEQESNRIACKEWALADGRWQNLWASLQLGLKKHYYNLAARQCAGLETLLQRPWFERIWILQEVFNAKRAIICSGTMSVSTRIFVIAPSLMHIKVEPGHQAVLDIMPGPSRESWRNLEPDLYTLLKKFKRSKAVDPRDLVYALLGICSDAQDARVIPVDYTREPVQVVRDVASFLFGVYHYSYDSDYDSVYRLIDMAALWNADFFLEKLESEDVNRIRSFLRFRGDTFKITEKMVSAAASNIKSGDQIMCLLLELRQGETLIAAAPRGAEAMERLLCHQGDAVEITEEGVTAAAESMEWTIRLLLDKRGHEVKITEEVVKAAAGSTHGHQIMCLLLDKRGHEVKITEGVLEAAARNKHGHQIMCLLFDKRGHEVKITEGVLRAVAGSTHGGQTMCLLLDKRGHEVKITEGVLKAAAGNKRMGDQIMRLLLDKRGHEVRITEEVVKVAAGNRKQGEHIMLLLLINRGGEVKITREVIGAARVNKDCGERIMELLRLHEQGAPMPFTVIECE